MKNRFQNKVVFITGASSGIGAELARQLAREGARLSLFARREENLKALQQEIQKEGGQVEIFRGDVREPEDLERAVVHTLQVFGAIDLVIANAGIGIADSFPKLTVEDYRRQFEVNFFGLLHTLYATLDALKKSKGQVVLIGSIAGLVGTPTSSPYNASKFAVVGLAESIFYDLEREGIALPLINPGFVDSEIRLLNNEGERHGRGDPIPSWLVMKTPRAAKQMLRAIHKEKAVVIITFHGRILAWMKRFIHALTRRILRPGYYRKVMKI